MHLIERRAVVRIHRGERAAKLMEIKPHVKPAEADEAIEKVDHWLAQVGTD